VGWRGDYLPYKFAVEDVRPLTADRSHVPPSGHTVFKLPGCYLCVFTVRRAERDGMWVPFFHKNLDYLETLGYHYGDFFSAGGVVQQGMVTVHPVGLPHGPKPGSLKPFLDGRRPEQFDEVGIMADFANPARISEFALGLSRPGYMASWGGYVDEPRFAWSATRLDEVRALGERLAGARDTLRPPDEESGAS
jgi:homogentisate 1,2-dioxygenase